MNRLLPLACVAALAGCRPAEEIRTYTVPKPKDTPPAASKSAPGEDTNRLLGALIPSADGRFFSVKLSGPIAPVSAHADTFRAFVESVRVTNDPAKPLSYAEPAGWKPGGGRQMRLATLVVSDGPPPLEVAVFPPFGGSLLDNINRWRKEVGAAPVTEAELASAAPELKLGDSKGYYIDARGSGGTGGMAAPFMQKK